MRPENLRSSCHQRQLPRIERGIALQSTFSAITEMDDGTDEEKDHLFLGTKMKRLIQLHIALLCAALVCAGKPQAPTDVPVFEITPVKSTIKFAVKASVPIEGVFDKWDATLVYSSNHVEDGVLDVKIQASSVNTGSGMKDGKLKSKDFFDAQQDRTLRFTPQRLFRPARPLLKFRGPSQFAVCQSPKR